MNNLGPIDLKRREGQEPFHVGGEGLGVDLLSSWRWSSSGVVSNAARGGLAEYFVGQAVGVTEGGLREVGWAEEVRVGCGTWGGPRESARGGRGPDGDAPGERAAVEAARRCVREGRKVRIGRPPRGMDWNDVLRQPVEAATPTEEMADA